MPSDGDKGEVTCVVLILFNNCITQELTDTDKGGTVQGSYILSLPVSVINIKNVGIRVRNRVSSISFL